MDIEQNRFKYALHVFKPSWYKQQLSGWNKPSYILWGIGWAFLLYVGLSSGITPLSITSTIAGLIGFLCTLAITNGKPINGILGFVSAIMLVVVAGYTGNYSDIIMQSAYVLLLDIPIMFSLNWNEKEFEPKKMNGKYVIQTVAIFGFFLVATLLLDYVLKSPQLILDATSATIGLTGAVLTFRKFRASYYFWLAQGLFSVALWVQTAMNGHAVWVLMFTYILYLLNDLVAFTTSKWFHEDKGVK